MSETKTAKAEQPPARQRQTITLNESTNEAQPRTGIKRRTDVGDTLAATAAPSDQSEEPSHAR